VKIKLLRSFDGEKKDIASAVAQQTGAELIQAVGGTIVLWKM